MNTQERRKLLPNDICRSCFKNQKVENRQSCEQCILRKKEYYLRTRKNDPNHRKVWKHSPEVRRHYALKKWNSQNPQWKGADVGSHALHRWVYRHKPKTELCESCKKTKPYDLANISQRYKRNTEDYEWLCRRCHMLKDGRMKNLKQYQRKR